MALGETHVIALTKRALGEAGVDVAALEAAAAAAGKSAARAAVARSPTTLLVKNLPYTSTETELQVRRRPLPPAPLYSVFSGFSSSLREYQCPAWALCQLSTACTVAVFYLIRRPESSASQFQCHLIMQARH